MACEGMMTQTGYAEQVHLSLLTSFIGGIACIRRHDLVS